MSLHSSATVLSSRQARHQTPLFLIALKIYGSQGRQALPKGKTAHSPSPGKCCSEMSFSLTLKNASSSKIHGMGSNVSQKLFQPQPQIWFHSSNAALAAESKHCHCSAIPVWKQIFVARISPANWIPSSHHSQQPAQMKVIPWICLQQSNPLVLLLLWLFLKGKFHYMNHYIEPSVFQLAIEPSRRHHLNARR